MLKSVRENYTFSSFGRCHRYRPFLNCLGLSQLSQGWVLPCLFECWPLLATSATATASLPTSAHFISRQQSTCSLHCHRWAEMTWGAWEATTIGDPLPVTPNPLDVSLSICKSKFTTVGVLASSLKSSLTTQPWALKIALLCALLDSSQWVFSHSHLCFLVSHLPAYTCVLPPPNWTVRLNE